MLRAFAANLSCPPRRVYSARINAFSSNFKKALTLTLITAGLLSAYSEDSSDLDSLTKIEMSFGSAMEQAERAKVRAFCYTLGGCIAVWILITVVIALWCHCITKKQYDEANRQAVANRSKAQ